MAITNAQQYKQLLAKGGRIGLKGGVDAATASFAKSYDKAMGNPEGTTTTSQKGNPNVGAGGASFNNNDNLNVPDKDTRDEQKERYEKQFFDKGEVPPLGSRPVGFKTKLDQRNKQKRLNYINYLQKQINAKLQKGLMDPSIPGVDVMTEEELLNLAPSVKDLVKKGFYSKDGKFAKGAIPDFNTLELPGTLGIVQDIFEGPVTSDKLEQLNQQMKDLEELKTTKGLESTNFNELMETYQPNRFKLENPEPGGGDNNQTYVPPIIPEDDTTEEDPKQILTTRILGSQLDPTFFANEGGRAGLAEGGMPYEGGIMDLESGRQMYFLGKLVKKAKRAVKKLTKSKIGKAALLGAVGYGLGGGTFFGKMLPGVTRGGQGFGGFGGLDAIFGNVGDMIGGTSLGDKFAKFGGSKFMKYAGLPTIASYLMTPKDENEFDVDAYYAANQLTPGTTKRQMGSEFDFYKYNLAEGGMPSKEPVAKKTMPLIDMDGKEMDLRAEGGFVPIGRMERADDVPARLSKNEFVFTADAVRNAGEGDIDKGAEVMYNMMKNLESGGEVSEESQGLDGAREMFQTSKRLEEVL